ncbi:MAG: LytTR family transcriptional regulator DNA-binding domain-containing protein [Prevotellaceae bacterium]|jgi:hypothetical protein|nr:LytTR family transcriptional regulator DNA-binding domain-containing protein [Prevotellaceae bacterium]
MRRRKIILSVGVGAIFVAMQMLFILPLIAANLAQISIFVCIFTAALALVNCAAGAFFRYANVIRNSNSQQIINICALAVVAFIFVFGLCFGFAFLFFQKDIFIDFLKIVPAEILIFGLLFSLIILKNRLNTNNLQNEEIPQMEIAALSETREKVTQITVKSGSQVHIVPLNEILYLQADGDYVQIRTTERKHMKEQTMKFFEQCLPSDVFVRVHRSYIVNIRQIARIEKFGKDTQTLILKNDEKIKASIVGYRILREKLGLV